jgi:hypothetical protein
VSGCRGSSQWVHKQVAVLGVRDNKAYLMGTVNYMSCRTSDISVCNLHNACKSMSTCISVSWTLHAMAGQYLL